VTSTSQRSVVSDFFNEPIFYGGLICTRAEAMRDMEGQGMDQRCIDRWMQGAQLAPEPSILVVGGEEYETWDAIGVTPAARGEGPDESVAHYFEIRTGSSTRDRDQAGLISPQPVDADLGVASNASDSKGGSES